MKITTLYDGTGVLYSSERFKILHFTPDDESQPDKFGVVLTEEMKGAINQPCTDKIRDLEIRLHRISGIVNGPMPLSLSDMNDIREILDTNIAVKD